MDAHAEIEAITAEITALARKQAELHKRRVELGFRSPKMVERDRREAKRGEQGSALRQSRENWLRTLPYEEVPLEDMQGYCPSTRLGNVLKNAGVWTVGDLLKASPDFIREQPYAGKQTVEEFVELRNELGGNGFRPKGWFIRR